MGTKKVLNVTINRNNDINIEIYNGNIILPLCTKDIGITDIDRRIIAPIEYIDRIYIETEPVSGIIHSYIKYEHFLTFKLNFQTQIILEENYNELRQHIYIDDKIKLLLYYSSHANNNVLKLFNDAIGLKNVPTELKQLFVETL